MITVADRFWSKVTKTEGCWLWTAYRNQMGYGQLRVGSKRDGTGRTMLAHRLSWEMRNGLVPDGMCVLHRCDNPSCVKPEHLFLGTRTDNSNDKVRKGRQSRVAIPRSLNHNTKVSSSQLAEMVAAADAGETGAALARRYGIHKATACKLIKRARWA